ncbi:hypothetical protein A2696_03175 [Candidatus Curtissbacteria bacterium RIFCSPHIGHO2_01_FULL_41_13]|uniref:Uncharacterized protein n=1 Tax=Candidatus Curtissbacteria bacterium RIFCSPHIGHO2_01_FULL_41_13 TaxID=1797745 RepID=A0A1F5G1A4_9BACT|nr:MAG: hypothetical protein A2696_03175 [Candidatus Curtissbacteria bacterium RIFCSPHIGHO2_01_FULL_41_13]
MKFLLILILIMVTPALLFIGYYFFGGRCLPYRLVAQKIPKYENASNWSIQVGGSDMGGGGPCGAEIYFHTNDSQDLVFSFYKEKLQNDGWVVDSENKLADPQGNIGGNLLGFKKDNYSVDLGNYSHDSKWNFVFSVDKEINN